MSDAPELVPENFLKNILDEFGIQWTTIAILSGVAFSSFGLDKYLHAGAWMLLTIASFCLVYLFRRQLSGNFPKIALASGAVVALGLGTPLGIQLYTGKDIGTTLSANRAPWTAYIAFVAITPVACMILSYRKQETIFGGPYPKAIQEAIIANIVDLKFYKTDQLYALEVVDVSDTILTLRTRLSYVIVNRTKSPQKWTASVISQTGDARYINGTIGNESVDVHDPDYITKRGLFITRTIPPLGRVPMCFTIEDFFRIRDSEVFTTYIPATSFTLRLHNPYPEIVFNAQSLLPEKVDPKRENGDLTCKTRGAVLSYQGFRLLWQPKSG